MNKEELIIKFIKNIRIEKGITQEELAEKAQINEKHYGRIERGENSPSLKNLIKISSALNIEYLQIENLLKEIYK